MSEFIEVLSPSALKDLQALNSEITKTIAGVKEVNANMISIKTPSGSDSAMKALTAQYDAQAKNMQTLQKALEKEQQERRKTVQTILDQSKSYQSLEKQRNQAIAQAEKEANLLEKANGLYNQTQAKVNQLSQAYNNLAIKKELGVKLTTKEELQLSKLVGELNVYQSALKKVDADIQKHGRNVGNYSSAYNGLGNSINQLTREAPAFANSLNTGFMALSNNLPILFDEIQRVKLANKELIAQGQPVKSTFMQLAGAVLSWQTALSVGVTLLTLYGGKIIDSISGSEKKKKALEAEKKAIEDKIEAERQQNESIGQSIASEQNRARILFEIARNQEISDNKRNEALKELKSRYGTYLKDLTDQQILAGETAEAEERLNQALIGRGYALATQSLLEKNLTAQMSAQVEYQKVISKFYDKRKEVLNDDGTIKNLEAYQKMVRETVIQNGKATTALNAKLKPLKEEEALLLNLFRGNAKYLDIVNETTETKKKAIQIDEQYQKNSKDAFEANIKALEETLDGLDRFSSAYDTINGLLILQKTLYEQLFGTIKKGQEDVLDTIELTDEQIYEEYFAWLKLKEATDAYIKNLASGQLERSLNSIGLASAKMFLDFDENGQSTFDKLIEGANTLQEKFAVTFQAIGDTAQEVFALMNNLSDQRFQNEYANLEKEKEIALMFAGESTSAREEIERQYAERQRQIKIREFQNKKQQAKFNIIIDTAQGIMNALASGNVPLSIAIGVIGALQLATVSAQQTPQYEHGTDNHIGGDMIINDQKGSNYKELVETPDGKKRIYDGRNVRVNAPKGTKVKTASETMDYLMFNNDLNSILTGNGISNPKIELNAPNIDLTPVVNAINNKDSVNIYNDGIDIIMKRKRANELVEITNKRINFKGGSV